MKLFKTRKDASLAHIFKSELVQFLLSKFKDVDTLMILYRFTKNGDKSISVK